MIDCVIFQYLDLITTKGKYTYNSLADPSKNNTWEKRFQFDQDTNL